MAQLIMKWTNDKREYYFPELPHGISVKTFPEFQGALAAWQDIMRYLAKDGDLETGGDYYKRAMLDWPNYNENMCYFLFVEDQPAATLAVICNYEKKQGYIHMVSCKPQFRGKRLGHLLNEIAVYTLKREGMETAYLTTDDWRLPAIKTYLKAGFEPDLETEPDFKERWEKIYSILQDTEVPMNTKEFLLPYGKEKIKAHIASDHLAGVLISELHNYKAPKSGSELVQDALEHPIGSPRLCDMAVGKQNIVVISSDHTRPVPSHIIMPLLLAEIRKGNPDADITILISTGLHRTTTQEELAAKFGPEIMANEKIIVHDCDDTDNLVSLGKLPSGGNLIISKLAADADLLVAEGFIEPHFFAGFSGGRKSVLPGVASRETVMYNHNAGFIADPNARTGVIEGNPIHNDMLYAARAARLDFIVNVVIDAAHDPIFAVAGDCDLAHRVGREFLASKCQVNAVPADIAISTNGGYPLDQNIYQSVKGMTAAEATVKTGGVIIMVANCSDGHGGKSFHETFRDEKDLNRMMDTFLSRKPEDTIIDQWQSQIFARVLLKAPVIFVSSCEDQLVKDLHMIPAHSMEEALEKAKNMIGKEDYTVTVIPDGVSVIVKE